MDYLDDLLRNISGWDKADPQYLSIVDNNRYQNVIIFIGNWCFICPFLEHS